MKNLNELTSWLQVYAITLWAPDILKDYEVDKIVATQPDDFKEMQSLLLESFMLDEDIRMLGLWLSKTNNP